MTGNHPYHKSCYKERYHPRCEVCKLFVSISPRNLLFICLLQVVCFIPLYEWASFGQINYLNYVSPETTLLL